MRIWIAFCLLFLTLAASPFSATASEATPDICKTGLFVNPVQLARTQRRLADPKWQDHVKPFLIRVDSALKLRPTPYTGRSAWTFLDSGRKEIIPAMNLALYAAVANEPKGKAAANRSKEILLAWARESVFDGQFREAKPEEKEFPGLGLFVGLMGIGAVHAYHLLKCNGSLSAEEDRTIADWLRRIAEVVVEGQNRWKANNYFSQPVGNNHMSWQNTALYSIGIAVGNPTLSDWVIQGADNRTSFTRMLDLGIYDGHESAVTPRYDAGAIPKRGEITDRYRMIEGRKGLHYAFFHLLALTLTAEVAINQGMDLFRKKAANGETLADPALFYGEFLSVETCPTSSNATVSKGPVGFEYYRGAPIDPLYWNWIEALMSHLSDNGAVASLAARVRATSCKTAPPEYLPIPVSVLTDAAD